MFYQYDITNFIFFTVNFNNYNCQHYGAVLFNISPIYFYYIDVINHCSVY